MPGRGDETASASREPWVDANGYQAGYLRAIYPNRPPVLAYLPDKLEDRVVPYDSLELALIEAWMAGGNYILAMEPHYREALLSNDPKATAAWNQLGRTARWLREKIRLFRQPSFPIVTALVDAGPASAEIANLSIPAERFSCPGPVTAIPSPDPQKRLALVAANLKAPAPEQVKQILAHAGGGYDSCRRDGSHAAVVESSRAEAHSERARPGFITLGKGQVVAYQRPIADPSEFALDVIDIITHRKRAVRLWNGPAVIALATGREAACTW